MKKLFLFSASLLFCFLTHAQILLTESFDNVTFPPTGWTVVSATSTPWARVTSSPNYPTPVTPHTGAGMAFFDCWNYGSGSTSELATPVVSLTATGSKQVSFWVYRANYWAPSYNNNTDQIDVYVNTTQAAAGGTLLGTAQRSNTLTPACPTGWYNYIFPVPASFNTATNYFIFKGTSAYGESLFMDDVQIANLVACTGTPVPGTASASPNPVCPNIALTLTAVGMSVGGGIGYQWQSAPSATGPWTNITGATTAVYSLSAGITATTYFKMNTTCLAGAPVSTNVVTVTLNSVANCYCTPQYSTACGFQDDINTVTLVGANSTSINQPNTGCTTGGYANYTSLTPVQMVAGSSYSGTMNSEYSSSEYVNIWIDFNDNGVFTSAESVGLISNMGTTLVPYTLAIPSGSIPGLHRMRMRLVYAPGTAASIDPCILYTYGETHDYNAIILGPPPVPTVTSNSPVCSGASIVLTATNTLSGVTFNWTGPNSFTATGATVSIPNATAANAGSYSVTSTLNSYTSAAASTVVTITPPIAMALGTLVIPSNCLGATDGSIQLTGLSASTAYTLTYTKNGSPQTAVTFTSTAAGTYVLANLSAANYSSIVASNNITGCASVSLGPVVLSPTPPATPTAVYNPPLCIGSTLAINVTNSVANGTYNWTGPTSFVASGPNITRSSLALADAGNYNVTVTVNGCISAIGTVAVVINPPPAAPTVTGLTYCQNDVSLPLTATGQNLRWYIAPTGGTQLPGPPTPSTAQPGNFIWYVSQTTNTCEGPRAALTVLVNPTPATPLGPTVVTNCQYNTPIQLSMSGANLKWYTTPTGGTSSTVAPTPATLVPGTYTWYVTQTVLGCQSARLPVVVTIIPKPAPPTVSTPIVYCQYQKPMQLTAIGQNLKWYTSSVGGQGSTLAPVPNADYEDTTSWWVTQTVNGCESDRSLIQVMVYQTPNGIILFADSNQTYVCQYGSALFNYFGNARPDAIIDWKVPINRAIIRNIDPNLRSIYVEFDSAGNVPIRMQVNNHGCVSKEFILDVPVRPVPIVRIATKPEICLGDTSLVAIDYATPGIDNFAWDFGGGTQIFGNSVGAGPYGITWPNAGTFTISVKATGNSCTSPAYKFPVVVHPLPDGRIESVSANKICSGDSIQLTAKQKQDSTYSYVWTPDQFFNNGKGVGTFSDQVWAVPTRKEEIHLKVYSYFGCMSQDSTLVDVQPCCNVNFPDAFTPNGDGRNDLFHVISQGHHKISMFRIVDRLGHTVFETADENRGWDGTTDGRAQDGGVYFYYIKYQCVDKKYYEQKGDVTLIR